MTRRRQKGHQDETATEATWPWETMRHVVDGGADIGPELLTELTELWQADEEWLTGTGRHVRWWPMPIPVDLRSSEPRLLFGDPAVKVDVGIRLLAGGRLGTAASVATLALLNLYASSAALWFDPETRSVQVGTTFYGHEGNRGVMRIYSGLALLGIVEGSAHAHGLAEAFGADLGVEPHPTNGLRMDTDDILEFVADKVIPFGQEPNQFDECDFDAVATATLSMGLATGGPGGLTAEFPFSSADPAMVQMGKGTPPTGSTSLYRQLTEVGHPAYGAGLLCLLTVPLEEVSEDKVNLLANDLNRAEATELTGFPAWGAWCPSAEQEGWLAHVAFIPSIFADPGVPGTLAYHAYLRSHWVQERLLDDDIVGEVRRGER